MLGLHRKCKYVSRVDAGEIRYSLMLCISKPAFQWENKVSSVSGGLGKERKIHTSKLMWPRSKAAEASIPSCLLFIVKDYLRGTLNLIDWLHHFCKVTSLCLNFLV